MFLKRTPVVANCWFGTVTVRKMRFEIRKKKKKKERVEFLRLAEPFGKRASFLSEPKGAKDEALWAFGGWILYDFVVLCIDLCFDRLMFCFCLVLMLWPFLFLLEHSDTLLY